MAWDDLISPKKEDSKKEPPSGDYDYLLKFFKVWPNVLPNKRPFHDYLRASGMYYLCPREFVLSYWAAKPGDSTFNLPLNMLADTGTSTHSYIQNRVLGPMGLLWGKWNRIVKGDVIHSHEGFYPDPDEALHAIVRDKPTAYTYAESELFSFRFRIRGHNDGFLDKDRLTFLEENAKLVKTDIVIACKRLHAIAPSFRYKLLEIKTVTDYAFQKLNTSRDISDAYQMQNNIYLSLTGLDSTVFWYVQRDSMKFKMFHYSYNDGWWTDALRKVRIVWNAIKNETLPESAMKCKSVMDKRAKECPHRSECWGKINFKRFVEKAKAEKDRAFLNMADWNGDEFTS